jgi:hypothetical protein
LIAQRSEPPEALLDPVDEIVELACVDIVLGHRAPDRGRSLQEHIKAVDQIVTPAGEQQHIPVGRELRSVLNFGSRVLQASISAESYRPARRCWDDRRVVECRCVEEVRAGHRVDREPGVALCEKACVTQAIGATVVGSAARPLTETTRARCRAVAATAVVVPPQRRCGTPHSSAA